jgi:hypothetical protein
MRSSLNDTWPTNLSQRIALKQRTGSPTGVSQPTEPAATGEAPAKPQESSCGSPLAPPAPVVNGDQHARHDPCRRHVAARARPRGRVCLAGVGAALGQRVVSQPMNPPRPSRPPLAFTTVVCGYREAGTILGCPGCWVARSTGGDYLGTSLTQRAARRAIEQHLEGRRGRAFPRKWEGWGRADAGWPV